MDFDLLKFRKDRQLTQQSLADMLCLPQSSISSMESGRNHISVKVIEKLKNIFGEDIIEDYILDEKVNITNYHVKGNNNGYVRSEGKFTKVIEQQCEMLERREARIDTLEKRIDKLQAEISQLSTENTNLKVILAKNGIEV